MSEQNTDELGKDFDHRTLEKARADLESAMTPDEKALYAEAFEIIEKLAAVARSSPTGKARIERQPNGGALCVPVTAPRPTTSRAHRMPPRTVIRHRSRVARSSRRARVVARVAAKTTSTGDPEPPEPDPKRRASISGGAS